MSRFHEGDWDGDGPPPEFYMQAIENCLNGKRGQAVLRELRDALLALPEKKLIEDYLIYGGEVCALGALARHRVERGGLELKNLGYYKRFTGNVTTLEDLERLVGHDDCDEWTADFGLAMGLPRALSIAIAFENDEVDGDTDEKCRRRYQHVLHWVEERIRHGNRLMEQKKSNAAT